MSEGQNCDKTGSFDFSSDHPSAAARNVRFSERCPSMRISAPSFLHPQTLSEWATYELKEKKNNFRTFGARF